MTNVLADGLQPARPPKKVLARAFLALLKTTAVYLAVALISGASYALCAAALNGGTFVRLWLASIGPIGVFLIARSLWLMYRRRVVGEQRRDLFG